MAEYVGFTPADAVAIRQTQPIIAKHLPAIVSEFYTHLLRYPLTRKLFLRADGTVNEEYLLLRMRHLSNFWLRSAEGVYDDKYAAYVDHVGRAHTSRGADPAIYVPERYVIGQVGMMQHAISRALSDELRAQDDELEFRAVEAWDKLMMVLLEMLARAYGHQRDIELYGATVAVDSGWVRSLVDQALELEYGDESPPPSRRLAVAAVGEIAEGQRKIIQVDDLSIGLFHHHGGWYAIRNSCIHQGGPVATGVLEGDVLTCPWHGYRYDLPSARCLTEPDAELDRYAVMVIGDTIYLDIPDRRANSSTYKAADLTPTETAPLQENEFRTAALAPGDTLTLKFKELIILICNVEGEFYAIDEACTHAQGPLSAGALDGKIISCVMHGSCFDVTTGSVVHGPATEPLKCYPVTVEGEIGRVIIA
jgi:nitrite reductase/ring-hydroxylating ferredoxin subunit